MSYKDKKKSDAYQKQYRTELYQWCIEHGFCTTCHKAKADGGYKSCLQCRLENRERSKTRTVSPVVMAKHIKKVRERKQMLVASGLCEECGKRPRGQYTRCDVCRARINKAKREKRHAAGTVPNQDRWNGQQCGRCLQPTENGAKLCPDCLAKMPKYSGNIENGFSKSNALFWAGMIYRKEHNGAGK